MTFSTFDIVLFAIIVVVALRGTIVGFVAEFFSKAAVLVGVIGAVLFYERLSPYAVKLLGSDRLVDVACFLAIFIVLYLAVKIIQQLAGKAFEGESMNNLDRALGFFLGAAEGLLACYVILLIVTRQGYVDLSSLIEGSFFVSAFEPLLRAGPLGVGSYIREL